jgi:hypothetical protein
MNVGFPLDGTVTGFWVVVVSWSCRGVLYAAFRRTSGSGCSPQGRGAPLPPADAAQG